MSVDLSGRVALVTGASGGIGAAVAGAFSDAGAAVALVARSVGSLEEVAGGIEASGGKAVVVPADVSDGTAIARAVEDVERMFGRLDFACNNAAGKGHPPTPLADIPPEAFDSGLETTLRGVFLSMRAEIPAILRAGGGAIVNVSSTAGLQGVGGLAAYCTAKHGLEGLTKVAALDYAERGVRVNSVAPSAILTDNLVRAGEAAQAAAAASMPVKRVGRPDEVADVVVWLCSEQATFVTGTTVVVDGGKLAGTPPYLVQLKPSS